MQDKDIDPETEIIANNLVVTKLKSWKEFFNLEELQTGYAQMKSKKVEKELSEESDGSDSAPSCDNFDE